MKKYLCFIAIALAFALPAQAGTTDGQATMVVAGSGNCEGPYERYEDQIRKRPLALVNESTRHAFVNCWFPVLK